MITASASGRAEPKDGGEQSQTGSDARISCARSFPSANSFAVRGFSAGARGRSLGISTFLRQPSTGVSRRAIYSLIGDGLLDRTQPVRPLGAANPRGWTQRICPARNADVLGLVGILPPEEPSVISVKRRTARISGRFWIRWFKAYPDQSSISCETIPAPTKGSRQKMVISRQIVSFRLSRRSSSLS